MTPALQLADRKLEDERPFLARLRLRAQRRVLWMRALWSADATKSSQGLAISDADVDRILDDPRRVQAAEAEFYRTNEAAGQLTRQIEEAESRTSRDRQWRSVVEEFGLSEPESDLLSLAVAVEVDPWWRRVCGYLHDDATASQATLWLASLLFGWDKDVRLGPESALVRWHLARPSESAGAAWSAVTPWTADPHIVGWLIEGAAADPVLGGAVQCIPEGRQPDCLYPELLAAMRTFVRAMQADDAAPVAIELIGPDGAGKQTLAAQLASGFGAGLVVADARLLLPPDTPLAAAVEHVVRAARLARLSGALLYWRGAGGVDPKIWRLLDGCSRLTLLGAAAPLEQDPDSRAVRRIFRMPPLTRAERCALWSKLAGGPAPAPISDCMLRPAEIAIAAQAAGAGPEAVVEACRAMLYQAPGELFGALPCPYTWDDIVLTASLREHLDELESQARLRFAVLEDWGFERLVPLGKGLTSLFAGPSGTGKTMAAQVLARSLGMELYRVDLAGVINKYIGETEKRLKRVFDACERAHVVLFFDEADALFGQRMQVKDAHDRFANIEIDYLLQRMEQFDGIAILATNRKEDLDKAFLRRLRFIIDFLPPGPAERIELWRKVLPPKSPSGEALLDSIDWELLANKLNLTGADIKAAALNAAFLARAEASRIGMKHILSAVRRQMSKHGQVLRPGDLEAGHG